VSGVRTLFGTSDDVVNGLSADGQTIGGTHNFQACIWNATTFARTDLGFLPSHDRSDMLGISADGTFVTGSSLQLSVPNSRRAFVWTAAGGMVNLGLITDAIETGAYGVSDDGTVIAVHATPSTTTGAVRWTAATGMVLLEKFPDSDTEDTAASAISGDGSTIAGSSRYNGTAPVGEYLAWWDAGGITMPVPVGLNPADPDVISRVATHGISGDGTILVGRVLGENLAWLYYRDPTPPPRLALDNVIATIEPDLEQNLVSLSASDDRGHSFGNPVSQSIGDIGEYRTSLSWRRLGMARDRVFRLEWSVGMPTALQGCWVEVTPAES
jgi:uncharacterized membrane protein